MVKMSSESATQISRKSAAFFRKVMMVIVPVKLTKRTHHPAVKSAITSLFPALLITGCKLPSSVICLTLLSSAILENVLYHPLKTGNELMMRMLPRSTAFTKLGHPAQKQNNDSMLTGYVPVP